MAIRWDSVLVRDLARELDRELHGARLRAIRLDARTREAVLFFHDRTMVWQLHPERSGVWLRDAVSPQPEDLRIRARVRSVRAIPDERILTMELQSSRPGRGPWTLVIELLGNQMNAIVTEGPDRTIRHVLRTREGARTVRVGAPWSPPDSTGRRWADGQVSDDEWRAHFLPIPPPDRRRELLSTAAWASPLNADACLSDAPDDPLGEGLLTWRLLASAENPITPVLLETARGLQPYPAPLPGIASRPTGSLLEAISACSDSSDDASPGALAIGPELLERLEDAIATAERRVVRLTAQLDDRENPERLRGLGDLVLARYGEIRGGASRVTVTDFEGNDVQLELDPGLQPHENASRYYDRAARSERAAQRLPGLIKAADQEADTLRRLLASARAGAADADDVQRIVPPAPSRQRRGPQGPTAPYRRFTSSGGLEIRVGRGSRHNDDLTFRHSSPNDVWLHARHTAGAHVILRWSGAGAPPARDLEEAACLAALHSKARTSGTVPVDWTLRKYVRKPRGSASGAVAPDRVQTLFVSPDPDLAERLGSGDGEGAERPPR